MDSGGRLSDRWSGVSAFRLESGGMKLQKSQERPMEVLASLTEAQACR